MLMLWNSGIEKKKKRKNMETSVFGEMREMLLQRFVSERIFAKCVMSINYIFDAFFLLLLLGACV